MTTLRLTLLSTLPTLMLVIGCSDYDLKRTEDAEGADSEAPIDTGNPRPDPPEVNACDAASDPGQESVPLNDECEVDLQTGSFTPVIEWSYGTGGFCGPAAAGQVADTNGSGDLDSDDMPMVFLFEGVTTRPDETGRVVALYGDGSGALWETSKAYGGLGGMALGDVDGDGWPELVVAGISMVCALQGDSGDELWCNTGLATSMDPNGFNYPSIADMNGDGIAEVTIGDAILHGPTGSLQGRGGLGIGAAPYGGNASRNGSYGAVSVPVDLDGDGEMELVTGNAAYTVDGALLWANTGNDGLVAVADFDGDGEGEMVKTTGNAIVGMESDGTEVWGPINYQGANVGTPAIDDLDGDGTPEIVFAAQNDLIAMEWGGGIFWTATIDDQTGAAGPVLFDFEMDGYPEVLYADERSIRFFSGLDGALKFYSDEHDSETILETPIVADIDGDDQVEIVLGHCGYPIPSTPAGSLTVFGDADQTWPPGRKIWNQHAYSITNVDDLGTIPSPTPNYELYNSFRSGDVGRPPSEFWDLRGEILDVCEDECEEGKVYVAARVNNAGNIEVPAGVIVSLRAGAGGTILDTVTTTEVIPPETTGELLTFEIDADSITGLAPVITADEDHRGNSLFYECDEDNNVDAWLDSVCDGGAP